MLEITTLSNGLTLIIEEVAHVESAAFELIIPGGLIHDASDRVGASLFLPELTSRGAGRLSSRELSEAFEEQGIRHGEGTSGDHYSYRGSCLAEKIPEALNLVAKMVLEPQLPEEEIDNIRGLFLQDFMALEDNPSRKTSHEFSKRYFPAPFNRPSLGEQAGIEATTISDIQKLWALQFRPQGSILSIAGKVKFAEVKACVEKLFTDWQGKAPEKLRYPAFPPVQKVHIPSDTAQVQIMLGYSSVKFGEPLYYAAKLGTGILSGGMFGRLFIEVREKRGLCYSVYARHAANLDYGNVIAYAGTTPERASETLSVMLSVLKDVGGTITPEELERSRANLLASLVMGEESTSSRASSNASEWWLAKKVRGLAEIKAAINAVTLEQVNQYYAEFPLGEYMLVTLGSRELDQ